MEIGINLENCTVAKLKLLKLMLKEMEIKIFYHRIDEYITQQKCDAVDDRQHGLIDVSRKSTY